VSDEGDNSGIWYREDFGNSISYLNKIQKVYFSGNSKFQKIDVVQLGFLGKTLYLDSKIQSAQLDEYIYHEALVHPALLLHPEPKKVLIIGGGEGATLREVLKHKNVEKAVMVDIDGELVEFCKEYMPEWSDGAYDDSRAELIIGDAKAYIEKEGEKFDVIISDLTEPLEKGPSVYLFTKEFYNKIYNRLNNKGVFIAQSGSAFMGIAQFMATNYKTLQTIFDEVIPYQIFIFSFSMMWGFNLALKNLNFNDEIKQSKNRILKRSLKLKHLDSELIQSMTILSKELREELEKGKISTDSSPFFWTL